tara:strand:+ start:733 stop:1188 length:456 start_codon:yes stop_codon:yes gene_type:complete
MDYSHYNKAGEQEDKFLLQLKDKYKSIKTLEFTTGNVVYDAIINNNTLVEIKIRTVNDYVFQMVENEGVLLQQDKQKYIINRANQMDIKNVIYISYFKNQSVFDIHYILKGDTEYTNYTETIKYCNKQTYSSGSNKIKKELLLFKPNFIKI